MNHSPPRGTPQGRLSSLASYDHRYFTFMARRRSEISASPPASVAFAGARRMSFLSTTPSVSVHASSSHYAPKRPEPSARIDAHNFCAGPQAGELCSSIAGSSSPVPARWNDSRDGIEAASSALALELVLQTDERRESPAALALSQQVPPAGSFALSCILGCAQRRLR
jgi:hypothetical protein